MEQQDVNTKFTNFCSTTALSINLHAPLNIVNGLLSYCLWYNSQQAETILDLFKYFLDSYDMRERDMRCYFDMQSKADSLIYHTEPTTKQWKTKKLWCWLSGSGDL